MLESQNESPMQDDKVSANDRQPRSTPSCSTLRHARRRPLGPPRAANHLDELTQLGKLNSELPTLQRLEDLN
jgi:hypothetical protein